MRAAGPLPSSSESDQKTIATRVPAMRMRMCVCECVCVRERERERENEEGTVQKERLKIDSTVAE
jgi:hypothetical protein